MATKPGLTWWVPLQEVNPTKPNRRRCCIKPSHELSHEGFNTPFSALAYLRHVPGWVRRRHKGSTIINHQLTMEASKAPAVVKGRRCVPNIPVRYKFTFDPEQGSQQKTKMIWLQKSKWVDFSQWILYVRCFVFTLMGLGRLKTTERTDERELEYNRIDRGDMVSLFSRFSGSRAAHRRSQSAMDEREAGTVPSNTVAEGSSRIIATHGIEVTVEFKPVEHPLEPLDNDQPIRCPLPDPSILNDGRIWKERLSANVKRTGDLVVVKADSHLDSVGGSRAKPKSNRLVLPSSISAPERNIIALLEECNTAVN
ncbi:hypothetical protein H6P81_007322 [Aristolochia fimbriata]|uniref:Uncharacterized protein n=1 Tax=Aristolochia fimbriata TaxID=158543 RepID=A0AAV7F025_ARIFI|nr:hypothetical protein H6P81_007322 [Aristolochia fimbriata]